MSEKNLVDNRSEIVFIYDAERANPNGNPMSSDNEPRVDKRTGHAIVTDVRLKRYIRDQMVEDLGSENVYIRNTDDNLTREQLLEDLFPDDLKQKLKSDKEELEEEAKEIRQTFLNNALDVRLFGATLSVGGSDSDDDLMDILGDFTSITGPLQFSPSMSLNHPVQFNEEYDSLTSVVSTNEESDGGGYDLDDKRLRYAVFPFHGIINENTAKNTNLQQSDVELLDTLLWKSIKNQTLTRSKVGQEPRFYLRVEYDKDNYHIGDLHNMINFGEGTPNMEDLRTGYDVCLDLESLFNCLSNNAEKIDTVHINGSDVFDYEIGGETGDFNYVLNSLIDSLGESKVSEIN